jgi:hypothetical protein
VIRSLGNGCGRRPGIGTAFALCALMAASACNAQAVYKCVQGGNTSYQSTPCDGATVSAPVTVPIRTSSGSLPWEGLRQGMSPEDVKRLVPGLVAPVNNGRSESLIQGREARVAGFDFAVQYAFDDAKGLKSVHLERVGDGKVLDLELSSNTGNLAAFDKLTQFLRSKYGPESSRRLKTRDTGFPGLSASSEWQADGGRLFVAVIPVTAETSMLNMGITFAAGRRQ